MTNRNSIIRNASFSEFESIGKLIVEVFSQLDGFPNLIEQLDYYKMFADIGNLTKNQNTHLLVAVPISGKIGGAIVYFGDMKYYGSGGIATKEKNASDFRLLAVDPGTRGKGLGKLLTNAASSKQKLKRKIKWSFIQLLSCRWLVKCMKKWGLKDLKIWISYRVIFKFLVLD